MWRWSHFIIVFFGTINVFSTYVEVILRLTSLILLTFGILHVCGGDPRAKINKATAVGYSPRMWRWSQVLSRMGTRWLVFSTYVEVILTDANWRKRKKRILHVCGGNPIPRALWKFDKGYSPRMWRWSFWHVAHYSQHLVFSTYVEVIPNGDVTF